MKKILFCLLLLVAACSQSQETVKIGVMAPFSDDLAVYGENVRTGVDLAFVDMQPNVELIFEDTQCDPKKSVAAVHKFATQDVVAIVGDVCSGASLAAAPVAAEKQIMMVSAVSTSPDVTQHPFVFRTIPSDSLQGSFAAKLLRENGVENLAVVYHNSEYGVGLKTVLETEFVNLGGSVVSSQSVEDVDVKTQLTKVKQSNPDAIYIISSAVDISASVLKQIVELDIDAQLYGAEVLKSQAVVDAAGIASEGLITTSVTSGTTEFRSRYKSMFGKEPPVYTAQAYDAFSAIAYAIESGASSGLEVRTALLDLQFSGATGAVDFDTNGDVTGNYDVYIVSEGEFVLN